VVLMIVVGGGTAAMRQSHAAGAESAQTRTTSAQPPRKHEPSFSWYLFGNCSAEGEDCRHSKCCGTPGFQCYARDSEFASCRATCDPEEVHGNETKPWTCAKLGKRTPPPCSWEHENCMASGCCKREGFKCYALNDTFANCSAESPEPDKTKMRGAAKNYTVVGGSQGTHMLKPASSSNSSAGTSLFCFIVVTATGVVADGVEVGYEQELLDMMRIKNLSVFGCDASRVYEGAKAKRGDWKSVMNVDIFIAVWQKIQADGMYKQHDWTVKADADAVFLPDRLKMHLVSLRPPANTAVYLHNINFKFHFMGALEVLSSKAVDVFLENSADCVKYIGNIGGEDFFTMQCLDSMGVGHMTDYSLLADKYSTGPGWNMFDVDPCTDQGIVALHPYKAVNSWLGCYKVAIGAQMPEDFVSCNGRWHGEACSLTSERKHGPGTGLSDGILFKK